MCFSELIDTVFFAILVSSIAYLIHRICKNEYERREPHRYTIFRRNELQQLVLPNGDMLDEKSLLQYIQEDLETEIIPKLKTDKEISDARHAEKRCKTIIVRSIHDSQLEIIQDKESAKAMIDSLRAVFERKSIASQLLLR